MSLRAPLVSAIALAMMLVACSEDGDAAPEARATSHVTPSDRGAVPVGTIEGVIRLADGEEAPTYARSVFDGLPAGVLPATCSELEETDRHPLTVDGARGLANVVVAASGDPQHWVARAEPVTHEVHIRNCRLDAPTIAATRGDRLRIVNETSYPFMPDLGLGYLQAVIASDPIEVPLTAAGPRTIACGFAAPCGVTQLAVFHHPVHAVSGAEGAFRIENAPAFQDITLTTWHPLLAPSTITTHVDAGATVRVEIVVHRSSVTTSQLTASAQP